MAEIMMKWIDIMLELNPWRWLWIRSEIGRDVQAMEEEEEEYKTEEITRELPAITKDLETP